MLINARVRKQAILDHVAQILHQLFAGDADPTGKIRDCQVLAVSCKFCIFQVFFQGLLLLPAGDEEEEKDHQHDREEGEHHRENGDRRSGVGDCRGDKQADQSQACQDTVADGADHAENSFQFAGAAVRERVEEGRALRLFPAPLFVHLRLPLPDILAGLGLVRAHPAVRHCLAAHAAHAGAAGITRTTAVAAISTAAARAARAAEGCARRRGRRALRLPLTGLLRLLSCLLRGICEILGSIIDRARH